MKTGVAVFLVVVVVLLAGKIGAHDWGWGNCPTIKPMADFSVDKFLGLWHVIELFDSTSTCQTRNYTRLSETQLSVAKGRQLVAFDTFGVDHHNSYTGKLDIPDGDKAASMRVKWPLNIVGKADYTIFDTDYETYGAVFECQKIPLLTHRQSATILSRKPVLDVTYIKKVKQLMTSAGISTSHFDKIDNSGCSAQPGPGLKINIDENTLRKVATSAGQGIKSVATQVADGASSFADTVVNVARRLGSSTDGGFGGGPSAQVEADSEVVIIN